MASGLVLAQFDYNRQYSFAEVDTDGDGKITVEEAKAHDGFVNEAIYHTFTKARKQGADVDQWDTPLEKEEWEGLTSH